MDVGPLPAMKGKTGGGSVQGGNIPTDINLNRIRKRIKAALGNVIEHYREYGTVPETWAETFKSKVRPGLEKLFPDPFAEFLYKRISPRDIPALLLSMQNIALIRDDTSADRLNTRIHNDDPDQYYFNKGNDDLSVILNAFCPILLPKNESVYPLLGPFNCRAHYDTLNKYTDRSHDFLTKEEGGTIPDKLKCEWHGRILQICDELQLADEGRGNLLQFAEAICQQLSETVKRFQKMDLKEIADKQFVSLFYGYRGVDHTIGWRLVFRRNNENTGKVDCISEFIESELAAPMGEENGDLDRCLIDLFKEALEYYLANKNITVEHSFHRAYNQHEGTKHCGILAPVNALAYVSPKIDLTSDKASRSVFPGISGDVLYHPYDDTSQEAITNRLTKTLFQSYLIIMRMMRGIEKSELCKSFFSKENFSASMKIFGDQIKADIMHTSRPEMSSAEEINVFIKLEELRNNIKHGEKIKKEDILYLRDAMCNLSESKDTLDYLNQIPFEEMERILKVLKMSNKHISEAPFVTYRRSYQALSKSLEKKAEASAMKGSPAPHKPAASSS